MFFRFKQNKNIVNVTFVNHRFKLRRTFIKPNSFIMAEKGVSQCGTYLLSKMKDDSVVASLSNSYMSFLLNLLL